MYATAYCMLISLHVEPEEENNIRLRLHNCRCERELTEGSKKCSYIASQSQRKSQAPKRRGLKARVSR